MNTFKGLSLTALLLAGSFAFISPSQAETSEAPTTTTIEAPVEAPTTASLTYEAPTVTTSPASPTTEAPAEATVEAPVEGTLGQPVEALVTTPSQPVVEQPTAAPTPATEAPVVPTEGTVTPDTWNTSGIPLDTWKTSAGTDPYSGNPIVDCEALGKLTAEDYSCVPNDFYTPNETQTLDKWLENKCDTGDYASAGIGRFCEYLAIGRGLAEYPAPAPATTPETTEPVVPAA